eukprot:3931036-Prymnesium_polylepis.1
MQAAVKQKARHLAFCPLDEVTWSARFYAISLCNELENILRVIHSTVTSLEAFPGRLPKSRFPSPIRFVKRPSLLILIASFHDTIPDCSVAHDELTPAWFQKLKPSLDELLPLFDGERNVVVAGLNSLVFTRASVRHATGVHHRSAVRRVDTDERDRARRKPWKDLAAVSADEGVSVARGKLLPFSIAQGRQQTLVDLRREGRAIWGAARRQNTLRARALRGGRTTRAGIGRTLRAWKEPNRAREKWWLRGGRATREARLRVSARGSRSARTCPATTSASSRLWS